MYEALALSHTHIHTHTHTPPPPSSIHAACSLSLPTNPGSLMLAAVNLFFTNTLHNKHISYRSRSRDLFRSLQYFFSESYASPIHTHTHTHKHKHKHTQRHTHYRAAGCIGKSKRTPSVHVYSNSRLPIAISMR